MDRPGHANLPLCPVPYCAKLLSAGQKIVLVCASRAASQSRPCGLERGLPRRGRAVRVQRSTIKHAARNPVASMAATNSHGTTGLSSGLPVGCFSDTARSRAQLGIASTVRRRTHEPVRNRPLSKSATAIFKTGHEGSKQASKKFRKRTYCEQRTNSVQWLFIDRGCSAGRAPVCRTFESRS